MTDRVPTDDELVLTEHVLDFIARHATLDRDRNRFERVAGDVAKFRLARQMMAIRLEHRR